MQRTSSGEWVKRPGFAKDMSIGKDGSLWIISEEENELLRYKSESDQWEAVKINAVKINAFDSKSVVVISDKGMIYQS